ncbi:alpha/beta fold hydrolase [Maridesulfovibrio sp.]|uniref:esterase/lipase family protein n=1 Tax=Maridesulfovibrio sp. TaxID=2795000 RepID=UPI002A18CFD2|nr:alpha/beta fold hydrolase [Maridesulfovibrio sp.]
MFYLILAVAVIFLLPSVLILFAAFINRESSRKRPFAAVALDLLQAAVSAGTSLLIAVVTRPFAFLNNIPLLHKTEDNRPILMVHGLYHNRTAWLVMKHRLNFMGFGNMHTWQYNSFTTSYPELVLELRKEIVRLYEATGSEEKITLVGHSLGGLLISEASADPQIKKMVRGLVTMGTPFGGSVLGSIAIGRLGRSLYPDSSLFKGREKITFPDIGKTALHSSTDEMVLPWGNLIPGEGNWKVINCGPMGHVGMLYSRKTTLTAAEVIRGMR